MTSGMKNDAKNWLSKKFFVKTFDINYIIKLKKTRKQQQEQQEKKRRFFEKYKEVV